MISKEYSPLLVSSGNQTNTERSQNRPPEQGSYTECDVEGNHASTKLQETSERIFDEKNG